MKPFTLLSIAVFTLVSLFHLLRLIFGWEASINSMRIPVWLSGLGFIFAALLAFMLWRESRK